MSHTPGPWEVLPLREGRKYYGTEIRLSDGAEIVVWGSRMYQISERERANLDPGDDGLDHMCDGHYEDARDLANARLIAAAPEMFDALTSLVKLDLLGPNVRAGVEKIIAKAEGR